MTDTMEQLTLFSLEERIWCEHCRSNWGPGLKPKVLERLQEEHRPVGGGKCSHMAEHQITEPYYAHGETPWLSGWACQFPRPRGFGGLYQMGRG